jgi:gamma-glutamyltranspeptidase/glutathione hydrolase
MSFGVMGGHMQPQGHVQMMVRIFGYGQNPQTACDAPRWHVDRDVTINLEKGTPDALKEGLAGLGHKIVPSPGPGLYGGGQFIYKTKDGGYIAASDSRKDGCAAGF